MRYMLAFPLVLEDEVLDCGYAGEDVDVEHDDDGRS